MMGWFEQKVIEAREWVVKQGGATTAPLIYICDMADALDAANARVKELEAENERLRVRERALENEGSALLVATGELRAEVKVLEEYVVTIGGAIKDLADLSDSMVDVPEEE